MMGGWVVCIKQRGALSYQHALNVESTIEATSYINCIKLLGSTGIFLYSLYNKQRMCIRSFLCCFFNVNIVDFLRLICQQLRLINLLDKVISRFRYFVWFFFVYFLFQFSVKSPGDPGLIQDSIRSAYKRRAKDIHNITKDILRHL